MIPEIFGDVASEFALMRKIAETSGRPVTFSLMQTHVGEPDKWRETLTLLENANADGVDMTAQVFPRPVGMLYGLDLSFHPFCLHPSFQPLRDRPLAERVRAMRDPDFKAKLLGEQPSHPNPVFVKTANSFRFAFPMGDPPNYEPDPQDQIQVRAAALGLSPHEYVYDLLLQDEGRALLYQPSANYRDFNLDAAREMEAHPNAILGLGDGGAHYGMICDASFPTFYLQRWVRDARAEHRRSLPQAIRALSDKPARAIGLRDRGRLAPGYKADINVIDLSRLRLHAPSIAYDLPAGGRRLRQGADGYVATVKAGEITYRDGVATGALPGRLVRAARAAPH
jgi:N-acyl-D-aspartate/D-glutamate deacylase